MNKLAKNSWRVIWQHLKYCIYLQTVADIDEQNVSSVLITLNKNKYLSKNGFNLAFLHLKDDRILCFY